MEESQDTENIIADLENTSLVESEPEVSIVNENSESNELATENVNVNLHENLFEKLKENNKHVFVLSTAGKPIYTRYGNENQMASLFGLMIALVSVTQDSNDTLQSVYCGPTRIVFLNNDPIILVGVSQTSEPYDRIKKQLTYVYNHIISTLTLTQLKKIFQNRTNFDLRRLMSGSERLIDKLITFTENDAGFLLDSICCLQMPSSSRDKITQTILTECSKIKNLVFGLLIAQKHVISIVRMKKYTLQVSDIHLILNLVNSTESFKTAESWTPICLPTFDASGFMHAHISYLAEDCQACLVLLTIDHNLFFLLSDAKRKITEKMRRNDCLQAINEAMLRQPLSLSRINIVGLRHLLYKNKNRSQHWCPPFTAVYDTDALRQNLMSTYYSLNSQLNFPGRTLKVIYQQLMAETMLAWATDDVELYMCFEPLVSKECAMNAVTRLTQWMKKEEDSLFIFNIPMF
ncbi:protein SAND isoform X2 [Adelges cooleyi]|nr:protein SAND isoform X2 [Adelges cooleyi]XP_050432409.1 protein SAND isoform X2 [Adelges cooleyi]XP_050432411.1 protein SAND isoform X2 [Adelges cooleyi]XP_050432412.1 protein SAND isoform X2 [Adelges cooleyi]XP_050432413.1 protein SAND isoform X2 [Adelges cooleyi]